VRRGATIKHSCMGVLYAVPISPAEQEAAITGAAWELCELAWLSALRGMGDWKVYRKAIHSW